MRYHSTTISIKKQLIVIKNLIKLFLFRTKVIKEPFVTNVYKLLKQISLSIIIFITKIVCPKFSIYLSIFILLF